MKILFLAHRTPYPPNKGDKIRSYHILTQLARKHAVSVVYWVDDPQDVDHSSNLRRICSGTVTPVPLNRQWAIARAVWSLTHGGSLSTGYYHSSAFERVVEARVREERPDLIYVFSSAMAQYAKPFRKLTRIIDYVDVDSEKWRELAVYAPFPISQVYRVEQKRLAQFEIEVSQWAECSVFVSEAEAKVFADIGGRGAIVTVPNGVALDGHRLPVFERVIPEHNKVCGRFAHILFVGTMSYLPNIDAVVYFSREILPRIRAIFPQVIFDIVGRAPSRAVRNLRSVDGVRIHGQVDDLQRYLERADVSVAPLRIARGVPNKILEAMAVGVPVVATSEAIKGLRAEDNEDLLLGDTPERFAEQVIRLLSDGELRARITKRARQSIQERYNWQTIGNQLIDLIDRACPAIAVRTA